MLTEAITNFARTVFESGGYTGYMAAGVLMALESMIAPIPSEAVMPFIGIAVKNGNMSLGLAMAVTSAGSLAGSLASYWLGRVGGKPLVMKVGKYLLVNEHHLDMTNAWFHKRGGLTVFVSRFVPVVRHLISIPAGIGRMPLLSFCLYTLVGATLWNGLLLYVGYKLQEHMEEMVKYYHYIDKAIIGLAVVGVIAWYVMHRKKAVPVAVGEPTPKG